MHDILDVIRNIQDLYENNSSLGVLKDFERVLDEMDLYVYKNWIDGELAYGPKVSRHWITCGFMWPHDKMPDPVGGSRLLDIGCKISYQKSHVVEPRKIKTPDDFRPGTKKGKLDHHPVWIVEITMPKKLAFDIYKGYMDKMKEDMSDAESLQGTGGTAAKQTAAPAQPAPAPAAAPAGAAPAPGGAPSAPPAA
jgi:hypothetical protein